MGIVARLNIPFFKNLSLTDEKAWDTTIWDLRGSQSVSGETVNETTAMTYSAVWNAVSLISGTIATLPLHLLQRKNKKRKIAYDRAVHRVMAEEWNPYMSALVGREVSMAHVLLWGNSYSEIVRNGYGDIIQLWPITPNRVTPEMEGGKVIYRISMTGEPDVILPREKVLHIVGLGYDGFAGYSVVSMAAKSLGLGMAMETFGARFFGNGTNPGMVVSHPAKLSALAHENLKNSLSSAQSGLGNSHRLLLLEEGMKVEKYGIPPNDCQFLESRAFQIPEVARWFNLPPHKLKDLTKSSFSNIESEQISFVTDSILPWLVRLEAHYNLQLLGRAERGKASDDKLYFKHSVEGLLRGDAQSRGLFYKEMWGMGAYSINEIRELEDKDPVKGGDVRLVPMNMTTLENAGKQPEEKPVETETEIENLPEETPTKGRGGNGRGVNNEMVRN